MHHSPASHSYLCQPVNIRLHQLLSFLAYFGASFNCFVHFVMYFYYLVSALGPQYRKYLWWKKYLTSLQLVSYSRGSLLDSVRTKHNRCTEFADRSLLRTSYLIYNLTKPFSLHVCVISDFFDLILMFNLAMHEVTVICFTLSYSVLY